MRWRQENPEKSIGMVLANIDRKSGQVFAENGKLADIDRGNMQVLCNIRSKAYDVRGTVLTA